MKLGQHQEEFAKDLAMLIGFAVFRGYGVRIAEVFRTKEQQALHVKNGKSKTMNSMHLKKCAADLYFTKDGKIVHPKECGEYWESLDERNEAGMFWTKFKDKPHYQRTV